MNRFLMPILMTALLGASAEARQDKAPTDEEKKAEKIEKDLMALHKKVTTMVRDGGKGTSMANLRLAILKFADAHVAPEGRTLKSRDGSIVVALGRATIKDKDGEAVTAEDDAAQVVIAVGGEGGMEYEYRQGQVMSEAEYARPGGKAVARAKMGLAIAIGGRGGRGSGVLEKTEGTKTTGASCWGGGPGGDSAAESSIGSVSLGGSGGDLDPVAIKAWQQTIRQIDSVDGRTPRPKPGTAGQGEGARSLDAVSKWLKEKKE